MNDKKFINPLKIDLDDFPIIVFSENNKSLVSLLIRWRTGDKNHCMIMVHPGKVVSQGFTGYKEFPIEHFMTQNEYLKFVSIASFCTQEEKLTITKQVELDLKKNWFKKSYDFIGIFGQLLGLKFINNPFKNYCSEIIASYCKLSRKLKPFIPYKPSPEQLNITLKNITAKLLGYWKAD